MPELPLDSKAFKVLGSETRLNILRTLDKRKMNLSEISRETKLTEATLHEHLNKLNEAGFIKRKEREGHKWVYYSLSWKGNSLLHPETTKILLIFSCIAITAIVIIAVFASSIMVVEKEGATVKRIGPKINYGNLATGQMVAIPDIGYSALYGYYYEGKRVGYMNVTTLGYDTYKGSECINISGEGSLIIQKEIMGSMETFNVTYNFMVYNNKEDNTPRYSELIFTYTEPYDLIIVMVDEYDKEKNTVTSTFVTPGIAEVTVTILPDDYWNISEEEENFKVGFTETINYITQILDPTSFQIKEELTSNIKLSIVSQEDIVVPYDEYENCYQLEIVKTQGENISTTKYWITKEGILPQMEINIMDISGMFVKLEEYKKQL